MFGETAFALGRAHVSLGLMAQESSNVSDMEWAWRSAFNWHLMPNQALRYSYAHGFRVPSLVETETYWTGAFIFGRRGEPLSTYQIRLPLPLVTNTVRLKPESIDSHAIGYFGTFLRSSVSLDLTS